MFWTRWGYYSHVRHRGRGCVWGLCGCLCVGPILAIIGIVFLVKAGTDDRSGSVNAYNAAVNSWTGTGYNNFKSLPNDFSVYVTAPSNFYGLSSPDVPAVESGSGITTYNQRWRYLATANPMPAGMPVYSSSSTTFLQNPIVVGTNQSIIATDTGVPAVIVKTSTPCYSGDSYYQCSSRCNGQINYSYSYPSSSTCKQWYVLSQMCFVVDTSPASLGSGGLPSRLDPAGPGCVPSSSSISSSIPRYNQGMAPYGYTPMSSSPGYFSMASVPITIRGSGDPWVIAGRVTGGSITSFGLTTGQKVGVGIGLLIAGLLLSLLPIVAVYAIVRCCASKNTVSQPTTTTVIVQQPASFQQQAIPMAQPYPAAGYPAAQPWPTQQGPPAPSAYGQQPQYPAAAYPASPYAQAPAPQYPPSGYPQSGYPQSGYPAPQSGYPAPPQSGYPAQQPSYQQQPQQQAQYPASMYPDATFVKQV